MEQVEVDHDTCRPSPRVEPGQDRIAAVAVQSINTDIRAVSAALKAREQEELVGRLEDLERALETKGERRYGA